MADSPKTRLKLFRVTTPGGEGSPAYTGIIEVPRAGMYWIDGYVERTENGETFIRGELSEYSGAPPKGRQRLPESAARESMQVQPGFWPVRAKRER